MNEFQIYELPQEIGNNKIFVAIIKVREDFCVLNLEIFTQQGQTRKRSTRLQTPSGQRSNKRSIKYTKRGK